ncbi:3-hydroxybutyrate dehydrogenase [Oceanicaulis sp.]|uniref:3-hydroxybutyrate dehydrogenase n=1 Tax=Oceanicaulis sp. TaxID=1924941 RepID=UPI003BAD46A3
MSSIRVDLSGHAAVITGSTSGIGLAMAEGLAANGADIVLNGLGDADTIETERQRLQDSYGVTVLYHGANMLKPDEIADLIAFTARELGRLDILVNCAGIQHVAPIEEFPADKWDAIIGINLTSAFHTIKHAVPIMKAQGRGRIVNIASAHALRASPFKAAYVAAKHGMMGLTKTVALETAEDGVTVNCINPGYVKTPLVENQIADTAKARGISEEEVVRDVMLSAQPTKKFVTYNELVGALLYLVSDDGANVNGNAITIDGGWTAK